VPLTLVPNKINLSLADNWFGSNGEFVNGSNSMALFQLGAPLGRAVCWL